MVGNTYPYQLEDWRKGRSGSPVFLSLTCHLDITLALTHGIDGFALNIGSDDWQEARVSDAYTAARGTKFKLFISFDMAYCPFPLRVYLITDSALERVIPCGSRGDAERIRKYILGLSVTSQSNEVQRPFGGLHIRRRIVQVRYQ
jgi:hypothetical protein